MDSAGRGLDGMRWDEVGGGTGDGGGGRGGGRERGGGMGWDGVRWDGMWWAVNKRSGAAAARWGPI